MRSNKDKGAKECNGQLLVWRDLQGKALTSVLTAPQTCGDPLRSGEYPDVNYKIIKYLLNHVIDKPWGNHLVLITALLTAAQLDVMSIKQYLMILNNRFSEIFPELKITTMESWKPEEHIPLYLRGDIVKSNSANMRATFWEAYSSSSKRLSKWLRSLPQEEQAIYFSYVLPAVSFDVVEGLIDTQEILDIQRKKRKDETDALVQYFADIRAEAHYRYNMMFRLWQAYKQACDAVINGSESLPFEFSYEEGQVRNDRGSAQERLHFRLWDRRSFVLQHSELYSETSVRCARGKVGAFRDAANGFLLEFVRATRLVDDAPAEGFWFEDMVRIGAIANRVTTIEKMNRIENWFKEWGYIGQESSLQGTTLRPFKTQTKGLLNWPENDVHFVNNAMDRCDNLFVPVEPLFAAATFGLLAVDLFTTTGARMNEALQVRLSEKGLIRLTLPPVPGAKDQSPLVRYVLRLIPKGQREDIPSDYYIGRETARLIERGAHMLLEHYGLDATQGHKLPVVTFNQSNDRSHRFGKARYLFQYNYTHLGQVDINSCMRFLLHGMTFKTRDGQIVIVKAHLLRHVFATYAVQIEGAPLDVVGAILNQKDLRVSDYYSQATDSLIAERTDSLLNRIALHINIADSATRLPEDMQGQLEEARREIGTLSEVTGGYCTNNNPCSHRDACVGCPHKVPDPEKLYQIEGRIKFHKDRLKTSIEEGSVIEAEYSKEVIRKGHQELREIESIIRYREDEKREVSISFAR